MKLTLRFEQEKLTAGAVRYHEVKPELDEAKVGALYVRKSAFKDEGSIAKKLLVTIETED